MTDDTPEKKPPMAIPGTMPPNEIILYCLKVGWRRYPNISFRLVRRHGMEYLVSLVGDAIIKATADSGSGKYDPQYGRSFASWVAGGYVLLLRQAMNQEKRRNWRSGRYQFLFSQYNVPAGTHSTEINYLERASPLLAREAAASDADRAMVEANRQQVLVKLLLKMTPKQAEAVGLYYGIDRRADPGRSGRPTYRTVGKVMGVSHEGARLLINGGIHRARRALRDGEIGPVPDIEFCPLWGRFPSGPAPDTVSADRPAECV